MPEAGTRVILVRTEPIGEKIWWLVWERRWPSN